MVNHDARLPASDATSLPSATIDVRPVLPLLAEIVAAHLEPRLCRAQQAAASGGDSGRAGLLRTQKDAAKASGLAQTEFKKRLKEGDVPANYEGDKKTPRSYDSEVLRLWALRGYPGKFDRINPGPWIAWLYGEFNMTPAGPRLPT